MAERVRQMCSMVPASQLLSGMPASRDDWSGGRRTTSRRIADGQWICLVWLGPAAAPRRTSQTE
eukprot:6212165-Pleurochrysis_carterae.AAC.4